MNVVDSSAWLEYFAEGPNASFFSGPIENTKELLIPTLCILEVFKKILKERNENAALEAIALMQQGHLADLTLPIAIHAAKVGAVLKLPTADSVIYATALHFNAVVWTQDADFKGLTSVKFKEKNK